jgi:hypothetical protein
MNAQAIQWYFEHLDQQGAMLLAENHAWMDLQLEENYLQAQDQEQEEEEEQAEEELWDEVVIPMEISEDEEADEYGNASVVPIDISDDEDDMPPHLIDDDSSDDEYELAPIQLFPAMDEDDGLVPDMGLLQLPAPPALQRSNTIVYQDNNVTIYNGNPDGSRLYDHRPDVDDE